MTKFRYVKPHSRSGMLMWSEVAEIADSLKQGALAVLPTETGYMLAALATSGEAVKAAFTVKGRAGSAVMHVACGSLEMAGTVGALNERAIRLLGQLTPGPVSVIVRATGLLSDSESMVTLNGTVGLRIPDHPGTLQVINAVGSPLTATSLNSSGSQLASVEEADMQTMNWPEREVVYVVRDDAAITYSSASALVRVSNDSIEILRDGPISESEIRRVADRAR
ncbi:MAG: L-threonylcarbamoyladenylate synthase [Trebonia sp.]